MGQFEIVAEDFVQRYLSENDYKYAGGQIPLKKSFHTDIVQIIEIISSGVAYGFLKELGADIYKKNKTRTLQQTNETKCTAFYFTKEGRVYGH